MTDPRKMAQAFDQLLLRSSERTLEPAVLGIAHTSTVDYAVPGRPGYLYVSLGVRGDLGTGIAYDAIGVQHVQQLVKLRREFGEYVIAQADLLVLGGAGGGSEFLADLNDVSLTTLSNGQALIYSSATNRWTNISLGEGPDPYLAGDGIDIDGLYIKTKHKSAGGIWADTNGLYVNRATVSGLTITTGEYGGGLAVGQGTGISVSASAVSVNVSEIIDTSRGIENRSGLIAINLSNAPAYPPGLDFAPSPDGGLMVKAGNGLTVDPDGVRVLLGPDPASLKFDGTNRGLMVKESLGLEVDPTGLRIKVKRDTGGSPSGGIALDSTGLFIDLQDTNSGLAITGGAAGGLTMGTPADLTYDTTSGVSGTSHSHNIVSFDDVGSPSSLAAPLGYTALLHALAGKLTLKNLDLYGNLHFGVLDPFVTAVQDLKIQPVRDLYLQPAGRIVLPTVTEMRTPVFTDSVTGIRGFRLWDASDPVGGNVRQLTINTLKADDLHVRKFTADEVRVNRGEEFWSRSFGIVQERYQVPNDEEMVDVWFEEAPGLGTAKLFLPDNWLMLRTINWDVGLVVQTIWWQVVDADGAGLLDYVAREAAVNIVDPVTGITTSKPARQKWRIRRKFTTSGVATGYWVEPGEMFIDFGKPNQIGGTPYAPPGQGVVHINALYGADTTKDGPYVRVETFETVVSDVPQFKNRVQMGNLTGTVDYSHVAWGFAAGDDLALLPSAGFRGITVDKDYGMRLFNTDLMIYDLGNLATTLTDTYGLSILVDSLVLNRAPNYIGWYTHLGTATNPTPTNPIMTLGVYGDTTRTGELLLTTESTAYASLLTLRAKQATGPRQASLTLYSGVSTALPRISLSAAHATLSGRLIVGRETIGADAIGTFFQDDAATDRTAGVLLSQAGSGDSVLHWLLVDPADVGHYWSAGIDQSDGMKWKISFGESLGITDEDYIVLGRTPRSINFLQLTQFSGPVNFLSQTHVSFAGDAGIGTTNPGTGLALTGAGAFFYPTTDQILHLEATTNARLIAQGADSATLDLIDKTYVHLGVSSAERWFQIRKDGQFTRVSALNTAGATKLDFFMLDHASGYVGMGSQGVGMGGTGSDHVLTATLDLINRPSAATHILATTYADHAAADEATYDLKATTYKQGVTGVPFAGGAGGVYHFVAQFARGTLQIPNNPITGDHIMRIAAVGYAGGWSGPDAGTILLTAQENFTRVGSVYNAGAEWRFITRGKGVQGERTRLVLGSEGVTIGLHDNADSVMRWTITTGETVTAGLDFTDKMWKVSKDGDLGAPGKDIIIHNLADGKTYIPGLVLPEHTHPHTHPPLLRGAGDSVETFAVEAHDPATGAVGGGIVVTTPQILSVDSSVVRISRSISVGDGLDGGGDFSQNRGIGLIVKTNGGIILEPNPNGLSIGLASPSGLTLMASGLAIHDSLAGDGLIMNPTTKVMSLDMGAVVPATRNLSAGAGLMGGGNLTQDRTFDIGAGDGIIVDISSISVNRASVPYTFTAFTAGAGLTGGGDLATGGSFSVGAGTGIIVSEDSIAVDLTLFPLKTTQIIAGNGLIGGGTLAAPITLHVNPGDGIQLVADAVAVNDTVVRTTRTITTTSALYGGGTLAGNLNLGLQLASLSGMDQAAGLKIGAGPFSGIAVNANDIALDLAAVSGLQVVADGLRINLALISGLEIDPTYGFRIKLPVASGLILNGGLSLDPLIAGNGLSIDANKVMSVGQGAGILVGENDVSLDLAVVSGLEVVPGDGLRARVMADAGLALYTLGLGLDFASEPGLQIIPGDGLAIQLQTDSGLEVDHGLALSQAIAGNGLGMGSDRILHVQPGPGINVGADTISIDLGADYHWQGSHTWSTGTVTFNTDPQVNANLDFIGGERNITTLGGNLNLVPSGDLVLDPGGKDVLPGGSNTIDFGDYNRKWRTLFAAELYVETLVAQDVMASIGGRVIVSNTTGLMAAVNTTQTTIDVKHNNLPLNGYVVLQTAPGGIMQFEVLKVTSAATALGTDLGYRYTVVRNLDGVSADDPVGANSWLAGDAVMSLGADVGDGYIDLSSVKTVLNHFGPTMTIYSRTSAATWNAIKPVTTMGNLSSFAGIGTDVFGFAAANDLLLTPSTGLSGVVVKGAEGVSLYNTDIDMYEAGNLHLRIDNESGIALKLWDDGETSLYRVGWFPSVASPSYSGSYAFTMAYNSSGRVIHSTSVKSAFHQADIDLEAQSTSPNQYSRLIVSSAGSSWATNATRFMQDIAGNTFIGNFSDIGFQSILTIGEYTSGAAPAAEGLTIQQQSAGDATLHFFHYIANQRWTMGIDRSDDGSFKIGQVAGFGSNVALTINPANNIGIGTPGIANWSSLFVAMQLGGSSALMAGKANEGLYLFDGAYYDGASRRKNNVVAPTRHAMAGGQHYFSVAPAGSADGAITWTEALILTNAGVMQAGVGLESPYVKVPWGDTAKISMPFTTGASYEQGISFNSTNRTMTLFNRAGDGAGNILFDWPGTIKGNVGIGTTPSHKLDVEGNIRTKSGVVYLHTSGAYVSGNVDGALIYVATSAHHFFYSSAGWRMVLDSNGLAINNGLSGPGAGVGLLVATGALVVPYIWANAANGTAVQVNSTGLLTKATSSIRYKQNVRPLPDGFDDDFVMRLKPIMYNNKFGDDASDYVGFVAEDVWEIGGAPFVSHNDEGQVESLHYDKLTVPLVAAVQGLIPLKERVAELEQRIRELEAKL